MLQLAGCKAHHFFAKISRNDDGGIIIAGMDTFDGVFLIFNNVPSDHIVSVHRIDELLTNIDIHAEHLGSFILRCYGNRNPAGRFRLERIPV